MNGILICVAALAATVLPPRDPATVWDRETLYRAPRTWDFQGPFKGEATPIWIEGEPYRGKPTRCFAFYGVPEGASPEHKVPGIVLVHGGAGTAYPEWVRLWVRRGYAAVAVDNCGQLPIQDPDDRKWMENPAGGPRGWGRVDLADEPATNQWPYHAVAISMRAHSFLRSLPGVDTSNIGVTGISWGGFLTCILAAADDRFAYAVPVYGCGFNYERGGLAWSKPGVMKWSALWDPCVFLPYAKVPFLWVDGTNDFAFTLDRVMRSAALAKGESQFCTRLRMVHGHGAPGEAPEEILAFADFYARGRKDIVRVTEAKVADGALAVRFAANGRTVARAELLWTEDGEDVEPKKRLWKSAPVEGADFASGRLRAPVPAAARELILNLITDTGLITSTPKLGQ